ncbi:MAG TPA: IS1380 family transposase [Candidatus Acidoferrales bacterium]|nr:IS1380 family transposase [Candidatus Acidoferrales bacterium]
MTECNQSQFEFEVHFSRRVVAEFSGERLTTEGGGLLLRATDRKIGLLRRVASCFTDARDPQRIEHALSEMLAQRIYGLALGYEDLNDHEELRNDPLLGMLAGRRDLNVPLAGKSTLNRLELTPVGSPATERYSKISYSAEALDELLVKLFLEAHPRAPQEIVLDLDATDTPLHGRQEARFFHGYYGHYCYLPLYVFCGDHLLCAPLRPSNIDASAGSLEEVQRIVRQIRARWPKTRIILRADSGFCREELLAWCENNEVDYVFGFARNQRLRRIIGRAMQEAKQQHRRTGKPARVFTEFAYRTKKSWSRARRVIAKAEQIEGKENPRYLVTSLGKEAWPPQNLYEQLYCARGEMENRIKEQLSLFSDRLSTETLRANQLRLYFSSLAYVLLEALRRLGLTGTEWAEAQVDTIRLKLLKIAAQVRISARRIWIHYSSAYPWQNVFAAAYTALRC